MWKNEGWAALEAAVAVAQEKIVAQLERLADQEHALALRDVLCGVADRELRVVIFGEFNTGKSTLINALLGRRALVAKARPTTGQVTRVIRGHPERVVVTFDDERTEQCDLASVETFTLLDVHSKARDDIRCINVFVDVPTLPEDVILIDTPGLADRPEQTHRATREAATADLVLILLDATHLLGLSERRLASDWLACDLEKPVVPVLNFMNNVEPAERNEIRHLMTEWSCQLPRTPFSSRYFEVNALAALRNALGIEASGLANDDFQQLAKELHGLGGVRANNLRLKSRCSHLGTVLRSADTKNREALKLLQKDAEGVRREREIQLHQLLAVHERITNSVKIERAHCVLLAEGKL